MAGGFLVLGIVDDGQHVVIRPLAYCREKDISRFANAREFPIIPCNLCGSQPNLQRQVIKEMMQDWDKRFPGRIESMFRAITDVVPSHLADHKLFDFTNIKANGVASSEGDTAFDQPSLPTINWLDATEGEEPELRIEVAVIEPLVG